MSCQEATDLGAYVLGALEPAERAQVDAHLQDCPPCVDELAEFQALPPLLDRLTPEDVAALEELQAHPVPPPDLFERVAAAARGPERARVAGPRRWLLAAAAAAVLAVLGGAAAVAVWAARGGEPAYTATAGDVRLTVTATGQENGTALDITVDGLPPGTECELVVIDEGGRRDDAGDWTVTYTGEASFHGWTRFDRSALADVVLLGTDGQELVRLPL